KLAIQTGPILGAFGADYFTVACRTTVPAAVTLTATELNLVSNRRPAEPQQRELTSQPGLYHRFRVPRDPMATRIAYRLRAAAGKEDVRSETYQVDLPVFGIKGRPGGRLRIVIAGDSRSNADDWALVAAAILKEKPDLLVFLGDMCDRGTSDWLWDEHYLASDAARRLLATVPYYPVHGNHEEYAPVMRKLFHTPSADGTSLDWAQEIGPALIVGVDGRPAHDWRDTRWLKKTLETSKAKFLFFCTHYPAYSSGSNGRLDPKMGEPKDRGYTTARRVFLPLLRKVGATAFLASHEHMYERSELPGGITQIIAAGAGAPRSRKHPDAAAANPYSKVLEPTLHYTLFDMQGDRCVYTAKRPDGTVIESLVFPARKP
ncbi:MAG TPA: metallophosphoesterase, partial [Phycisphaerae bacterium]|nr:metallophosphoesterase [Phycisphaerae bacterium]